MEKKEKRKVSTKFAGILAILSIIGFVEIFLDSFFAYSFIEYSGSLWLFIMGVGFLISARPKNLYDESKKQFTETSFARLTTFVVGVLAIMSAVLILPEINVQNSAILAIRGVIAIISILFIVFQTWVLDH